MRILIVSHYFWPESFRINDLTQGLRERGHDIRVLTGMPNYPSGQRYPRYGWWTPARETFDGVEIRRAPIIRRGQGQPWRLALNYGSFALSVSALAPLFAQGRFDLVFAYQPSPMTSVLPALLLRRLKRAPMMLWVQDLWPDTLRMAGVSNPAALWLTRRLVHAVYRRSDMVLVQSRAFTPDVAALGVPPERIRYLPNWAEPHFEPLPREADTPEQDELPRGFRVLAAGNIGAVQAVDTVLDAAERLRDSPHIHWIFVGDGRQRPWLQAEILRRGLSETVHYLGARPNAAMPKYYAAADALLVSLRRDPVLALTVPSRLQPCLASGRPIVAALDGEGGRIVRDAQAGLVVASDDAPALAEAVRDLAARPAADREAMGQRGYAYHQRHFDRTRLLDDLEGWMHALVREGRCAS